MLREDKETLREFNVPSSNMQTTKASLIDLWCVADDISE